MSRQLRLALIGSGRAAGAVVAACTGSPRWVLAAALTSSSARAGLDVGTATGGAPHGLPLGTDLDAVLGRGDIDALLYTGAGTLDEVVALGGRCASAGKAFVTISGLVEPVTELGAEAAGQLNDIAVRGGGHIAGTGINPGFLLDVLPAVLSSSVSAPRRIAARRVVDMGLWGESAVQAALASASGAAGDAAGMSLMPSARLVAAVLGGAWELAEEVTQIRSATGEPAGVRRVVEGSSGATELRLEWHAEIGVDPDKPGAVVEVEGEGSFRCALTGEGLVDGYPATAARALNAVGPLLRLPPGLYRPDQLPASG